jgi:hypothetical protein
MRPVWGTIVAIPRQVPEPGAVTEAKRRPYSLNTVSDRAGPVPGSAAVPGTAPMAPRDALQRRL